MLQCELHWYSFRLFWDWIIEREQECPRGVGPCITNSRLPSPVHPGVILQTSFRYNGDSSPKDMYVCFTGWVCSSPRQHSRVSSE